MTDVIVPNRPVLVTIPNVDLIQAGRWDISTGQFNVTSADLYAAVAALDCPAVRNPVLKLGHTDPRFDGEPAVGWVGSMAVTDDGTTLVGDYCGLPAWLGEVMASAYPDRSMEGWHGYRCQIGHEHPFVMTAVALLGVTPPGIGTLESLQDVAALYGVAASIETSTDAEPFALTLKGSAVPNSARVAASATVEDVRRAFYEGPAANNWWWIEDLFIDPTEVIAIDEDYSSLWRVPFAVAADGEVTFADPQEVKREYVAASVSIRKPVASYASAAESRPGRPGRKNRAANQSASAEPVEVHPEREDAIMANLKEGLLQRLGITDAEISEEALLSAVDEALSERADETPAPAETPAAPAPVVPAPAATNVETFTVDKDVWESTLIAAKRGEEARIEQLRQADEALVAASISKGKIPPARKQHWMAALASDREGVTKTLNELAPGLIPTTESGHSQDRDDVPAAAASVRESDVYKNWSLR
jgi:hypothetical protein